MTRVALVNPCWDFAGTTCFGCREPHLPLELAYSASLISTRSPEPSGTAPKKSVHDRVALSLSAMDSGAAPSSSPIATFTPARSSRRSFAAR